MSENASFCHLYIGLLSIVVILHKHEFGTSYGVSFLLAEQINTKVSTDIHRLMKNEQLALE